jgi:hypothetical protein
MMPIRRLVELGAEMAKTTFGYLFSPDRVV